MKKRLMVLCIVTATLMLVSCTGSTDTDSLDKSPYDAANQSKEVTVSLDAVSFPVGTETFEMHFANTSDVEYSFGMEPNLDIQADGAWYVVPIAQDAAWDEIAYILPAGEGADMDFSLKTFYGSLSPGHYRVVKPLYAQSGNTFTIAEFTIE